MTYAFTTAGTYSVVAKITNATSTHGSASATHALVVRNRRVVALRPAADTR